MEVTVTESKANSKEFKAELPSDAGLVLFAEFHSGRLSGKVAPPSPSYSSADSPGSWTLARTSKQLTLCQGFRTRG